MKALLFLSATKVWGEISPNKTIDQLVSPSASGAIRTNILRKQTIGSPRQCHDQESDFLGVLNFQSVEETAKCYY